MILTQALFGAGNTRFVMIAELILHFTCLVPLAWLLGVTFDTDGVTEFENANDVPYASAQDFFDDLRLNAIVEVEDEIETGQLIGDGTADEMAFED